MKHSRITLAVILLLANCLSASAQQMRWENPLKQNFNVVRGQGWPAELSGTYHRLPARAKDIVREPVWYLSTNSAGLSVVFKSNSPVIQVRYHVTGSFQMDHMPATGVSGVDLYSYDKDGLMRWYGSDNKRTFADTVSYTYDRISYLDADGYEFHLYLPPYNEVEWLEIGVTAESTLTFLPASTEKPVVVYGTSIAQGACASRPGLVWSTIIERDTRWNVVNLGFSGNGIMEPEVYDLLSEIDARIYVIDCMPNMDGNNERMIIDRTVAGVHKLRSKTDAPILLVEHAGYANMNSSEGRYHDFSACNIKLEQAYKQLKAEGVKNLYLLPHSKNAFQTDHMVEGWHPNDLGMQHIASVTQKVIRKILK